MIASFACWSSGTKLSMSITFDTVGSFDQLRLQRLGGRDVRLDQD